MNQNKQGINSHVEEYLDYYCGLPHPPQFAILLKGQWGCGKTWFIKNYCKKLKEKKSKKEESRFLYVSLYGMTSFSEIELTLLQQSFPKFIADKFPLTTIPLTTSIFNWFLKAPSAVNLTDNLIKLINKNVSKKILIFDDLERCQIDINNILGYINSFVEHEDSKVIIVADEEKLETLLGDSSYKSIKEKLIGKTLSISFDLESSLNDFINKLKNPYVKKFLFDNTNLIQELYQQAEYKNLRTLNLIVLDFEKIFETFDNQLRKKVENKPEVLQEILKILIAFSIEIKNGILFPKDISRLSFEYLSRPYKSSSPKFNRFENRLPDLIIKDNNEELSPLQKILNKYRSLSLHEPFLGSIWWIDFFDRGVINKEESKKSILNSKYFQDENTPDWMKLFYFVELSDDNFNSLINEVELKYKNREYDKIGVVKHIHGLFLHFFEIGLYHKNKEEILEDSKCYIDYLKENNPLSLTYFGFEDSYNSLTFRSQEFEEFKQLSSYINQVQELIHRENMPKIAQDLLDTMQTDSYKFYRTICKDFTQDEYTLIQKYYDIPILKYMEPDIFVEKLLSIKEEDQRCIFSALKQRYKSDNINKMLIEELIWLKSVKDLLQVEVDKMKGKLSGYKLRILIEEYLRSSIEKLELKQLQMQSN